MLESGVVLTYSYAGNLTISKTLARLRFEKVENLYCCMWLPLKNVALTGFNDCNYIDSLISKWKTLQCTQQLQD